MIAGWMAGSIISIIIPSTSLFNSINVGGLLSIYGYYINEYGLDYFNKKIDISYLLHE